MARIVDIQCLELEVRMYRVCDPFLTRDYTSGLLFTMDDKREIVFRQGYKFHTEGRKFFVEDPFGTKLEFSPPDTPYTYDQLVDILEGCMSRTYSDDKVCEAPCVVSLLEDQHTHPNKALLDTYDQTNEDIKDAVDHKDRKDNPHEVTKTQVGLGNVDNTSDDNKPVSTAQAEAIDQAEENAKEYADNKIGDLNTDDIPEGDNKYFTEARVCNTPCVQSLIADQHTHPNKALLDTYTQSNEDISDAVLHMNRTDNPHNVTKAQVGLGNVDNTSDADKPVSTLQQSAINQAEQNAKDYTDQEIGALDTDDIPEGDNKYFTEQRVCNTPCVQSLIADQHTHPNKALLDTYDQSNEDIKDAVEHKDRKDNPHEVTAEQVIDLQDFITLQNFYNTKGYCSLTQKYLYDTGDQIFEIDYDAFEITDVFINGEKTLEYTFRYNEVEILGDLDPDDLIEIRYTHYCTFDKVYGIRRDKDIASPDWERIGKDMSLHASLPVQSQLRRCIVDDDGEVVYFLDEDDSTLQEDGTTPAILDGTDGQYMRRTPAHFQRFDEIDGIQYAWISLDPFPGSFMVEEMFASVAEATVHRPTNTLASVVSMDPDYRGGNNQSSWDTDDRSQLGMPATAISRTNFVAYAQNRGEAWSCNEYEWHRTEAWLRTIEYATAYHQRSFNYDLTPEGYRRGGLGDGPTTLVASEWSEFNGSYPLIPIGFTASLGNNSGEIEITLQNFPETGETRSMMVNSYRGIQNPFGHLWEWVNGINIRATEGGTKREIFKAVGDAYSTNGYDGYRKIGEMPPANGYITQIVFGPEGDILPTEATGGSATTYYTDYYYRSSTDELRGLIVSGQANNGGVAGSFFAHSYDGPSATSARHGSRLCYFKKLKTY